MPSLAHLLLVYLQANMIVDRLQIPNVTCLDRGLSRASGPSSWPRARNSGASNARVRVAITRPVETPVDGFHVSRRTYCCLGLLSRDLKQSIVETAAPIWNTVTVSLLCISNVSY